MDGTPGKIVGCSAVNEHVCTPLPEVLWHYTSFRAFQQIVKSKKIWASEYRFLNDRKEVLHARELAQELIEEEPEAVGDFGVRNTLRSAITDVFTVGSLNAQKLCILVASFTQAPDQLSQWRGYANDSRGVSIGFDLRNLRPPDGFDTTVSFAPYVYDGAKKRALLKAVFAEYVSAVQEWFNPLVKEMAEAKTRDGNAITSDLGQKLVAQNRPGLNRCFAALQFDLMRLVPLLKDTAFSEEQEWRMVLPFMPKRGLPKDLEFRTTGDALVPYIAWPFNPGRGEEPVPCKQLILGPGSHPSAEIGAQLFLQRERIQAELKRSAIPYRPT